MWSGKCCGRVLVLVFLASGAGCGILMPGAENVKVTTLHVPVSCYYRGDVDSGLAKAPLVSHKKIEAMQIVSLKNQALRLQANVVQVTYHETTYYAPLNPPQFKFVVEIKTHQMRGRAYFCDDMALQWLEVHPSLLSDMRPGDR